MPACLAEASVTATRSLSDSFRLVRFRAANAVSAGTPVVEFCRVYKKGTLPADFLPADRLSPSRPQIATGWVFT
jgi:hypothetical protein